MYSLVWCIFLRYIHRELSQINHKNPRSNNYVRKDKNLHEHGYSNISLGSILDKNIFTHADLDLPVSQISSLIE